MKKKQSGLGIASMIIGIMALLISCTGFGIIGIVSLIFSIIVLFHRELAKGMAVAGLTTSLIAVLLSILFIWARSAPISEDLISKKDISNGYYNEIMEGSEWADKDEEGEKNKPVSFDTGEIYNKNDCAISVDSEDVEQLKLEVQNNSVNDYDFYVNAMSVNGIMANGYDGVARTNIPSGKKGIMCVEFAGEWKDDVDEIEYIDIEISAHKNDGDFESFETGILRIETNKYVSDKKFEPREKHKETNGLVIVQNQINQNKISYSIINRNEYTVKTTLENCSINEWAFEPGYSSYEAGNLLGMKIDGLDIINFPNSISTVYVDVEEFLKEHDIEKVEEFEFSLNVISEKEYFNTEKITFSY